ncbi:hypothetical protein [Streptomyces sp. WAC01526]|uniref:hypothetical protein n=1 Tax=Streptomyces sp. WAC01526 TaxID=2588709 RepID=UPI001651FA39|nr:hypothetical protein [Streptomyces sp. WAC01526]
MAHKARRGDRSRQAGAGFLAEPSKTFPDANTNLAELVVLDGADINAGPIARTVRRE